MRTVDNLPKRSERSRPRVLVVGTGFAGYHCLRRLEKELPADAAELVAVNPADYMLYVPLLPEVAAGILDPRQVAVPVRGRLHRTRFLLGSVSGVDATAQTCTVVDVEGEEREVDWDYLVLACGSVTRLLSIPGVAEHAKGFKSIAESIYLRDHILRQLELAEQSDDPAERRARTTFVVVGAGYTGTEVVTQGQLLTRDALPYYPGLAEVGARWTLIDVADRVLPGLNERLSGPALKVLRRRGVDVRLKTSVNEVTPTCARLTDDSEISTHTVVWCVGVRPDPLIGALDLETTKGRLNVDEYLTVPGHERMYAIGDAAAVPDLTRPGEITPMTAQHAQRQGKAAARNIAAALGHGGDRRPYQHRDLGFTVDLGGLQAVADPLHLPITGPVAKAITRAYHLLALPWGRARVLADWITEAIGPRRLVEFGYVPEKGISLTEADRMPVLYGTSRAAPKDGQVESAGQRQEPAGQEHESASGRG
jgi:NADH:ubiquinone reductase (H+-translocating)